MKVSFANAPTTAPAPVAASPETIVATVPTPVADVAVETVTTVAAPVETVAAPVAPAIVATVTQAVAVITPTETAVAVPAPKPSFYDDESLDPGDLVLPRFNIVQKVGELSNQFAPGSIVLNGQLVIAEAPKANAVSTPVRILIVGFQPTIYTERVEGGLRGNMFKSEQEVNAKNGTLDWNEAKATGKTLYQRLATAMILVQKPEGLDAESFPTTIEGKQYALALYSMKGTSYTNAAKAFKSARKIGHLREGGYRSGFWSFSSQLKKFADNYAYIPVVKAAGQSTPEFRAAVLDLLGF